MPDLPWLPDESISLDRRATPHARPDRPVWQGDIFVDVPIAFAGRGDGATRTQVGRAAVIGHPCSIFAGPRLNDVQFVAAVRPLAEACGGRILADPWDGHYF